MRIDLHTHSEASRDGGITPEQYAQILKNELLDCVAITDHNRIDFARGMQKALGPENIIVGEEISSNQGDIIGLFLTEEIKPGMNAQDTIDAIKSQNGIVYIPHPFEKVRSSMTFEVLEAVAEDVDIIEGYNGRALTRRHTKAAVEWANSKNIALAASSDAHGLKGLGRCYTNTHQLPTIKNLVSELKNGSMVYSRPPFYTLLYPKFNRFINTWRGRV